RTRGIWSGFVGGPEPESDDSPPAVSREQLAKLLRAQAQLPKDFHPHLKVKRFLPEREQMASGQQPLDWSAAQSLAFATLACNGARVRLSGQDRERGTFSHRHGVLHDVKDGHLYMPLQNLCANQAPIEIFNSPLSEAGVLGFEYGYSL